MNVSRLPFDERGTLARAPEVGLWKILEKLLKKDLEQLEREIDESGRLCDEFKKDARWKLAQAAKLRQILRLPIEARMVLEPEIAPEQSPGG